MGHYPLGTKLHEQVYFLSMGTFGLYACKNVVIFFDQKKVNFALTGFYIPSKATRSEVAKNYSL